MDPTISDSMCIFPAHTFKFHIHMHLRIHLLMQTGKAVSLILKTKVGASQAIRDMQCADCSRINRRYQTKF